MAKEKLSIEQLETKKTQLEMEIKSLEEVKEQNNYSVVVIAVGEDNLMSLSVAKDANFEQMVRTYVELKGDLDNMLKELPFLEEMEEHGLLEE